MSGRDTALRYAQEQFTVSTFGDLFENVLREVAPNAR